jgi:WD40 repeat protein
MTFTTDAAAFASLSKTGIVELWKKQDNDRFAASAKESEQLAGIANASSICFHPQRETLAIGTNDGAICLWDSAGVKPAKSDDSHTSGVLAVAFDGSGQWLASADEQGWIHLWRIDDSGPRRALQWKSHTGGVQSLAFAPEIADQKWLASASEDGTVRIVDVAAILRAGNEAPTRVSGAHEIVLDDHQDWVGAVAFSPVLPILASAGEDGAIRLWQWDSWSISSQPQQKHELTGHQGAVTSLSFSQDGKTLASGGVDKMVRLWDPLEGHLRLSLPGHLASICSVSFLVTNASSHPNALASLSDDGTLKFWLAETSERQSQ